MGRSLFSTISSVLNDYHRNSLIESNKNLRKIGDTTYSLKSVDFDPSIKKAKIVIKCTKQYRTIERYVTRNYEKYPIYSQWKYKTTEVTKSLKLTNEALEALNEHEDELIRNFAADIIGRLEDEDLVPSWLYEEWLYNKLNYDTSKIKSSQQQFALDCSQTTEKLIAATNENQKLIEANEIMAKKLQKRIDKIKVKLEKIHSHEKSLLLYICTIFIYYFLNSSWREQNLIKKQTALEVICELAVNNIENQKALINDSANQIDLISNDLINKTQEAKEIIKALVDKYKKNLLLIEKLPITIEDNENFLSIKVFGGMKYRKIIGCYIIHNTERGKYYVGQSKDVMRRLKQHFKGTVPNNIIFAEDYFTSQSVNKENIFQVKIIRLETKDELDEIEKKMIDYYDAFTNGYNGTQGNS